MAVVFDDHSPAIATDAGHVVVAALVFSDPAGTQLSDTSAFVPASTEGWIPIFRLAEVDLAVGFVRDLLRADITSYQVPEPAVGALLALAGAALTSSRARSRGRATHPRR